MQPEPRVWQCWPSEFYHLSGLKMSLCGTKRRRRRRRRRPAKRGDERTGFSSCASLSLASYSHESFCTNVHAGSTSICALTAHGPNHTPYESSPARTHCDRWSAWCTPSQPSRARPGVRRSRQSESPLSFFLLVWAGGVTRSMHLSTRTRPNERPTVAVPN